MSKRFPANPAHPERICWGCDRYCPAESMACGNGSVATLHPYELFGADWENWGINPQPSANAATPTVERQEAYAQGLHAGFVFEIRAKTSVNHPGSHVHVLVHASPSCPHERSAEYLTEDETANGAVRSGIAIAQAMIENQAA